MLNSSSSRCWVWTQCMAFPSFSDASHVSSHFTVFRMLGAALICLKQMVRWRHCGNCIKTSHITRQPQLDGALVIGFGLSPSILPSVPIIMSGIAAKWLMLVGARWLPSVLGGMDEFGPSIRGADWSGGPQKSFLGRVLRMQPPKVKEQSEAFI